MIVHGPIAWLGVVSVDRRRIDSLSVYDYRLPLPVIGGGEPVGRLSIVAFRADGSVWAKGEVDDDAMGAGLVAAGVDMEAEHIAYDPPPTGDELTRWRDDYDPVEVMRGSLLGVTIGGNPAWPNAHLEVFR